MDARGERHGLDTGGDVSCSANGKRTPPCGVRVKRVPWAAGNSTFTAPFEELAAYLAQVTDRTTVSRVLGISWQAVGSIVERVVSRRLDPKRLAGLRHIGIDELGYRKRHHYLTVVVDHHKRRVVRAGKGRSAETLEAFFDLLGPSGCERIALVTADLAASWQKALRARVPHAQVVVRVRQMSLPRHSIGRSTERPFHCVVVDHTVRPSTSRRCWQEKKTGETPPQKRAAQKALYGNRRRIRGNRGRRLQRRRGELVERPFAHQYETGGLRRVWVRGHENVRKRVLIQAADCNLRLLLRGLTGVGAPRSL